MNENGDILTVRDLRTWFFTQDGVVKAVDGVSFRVGRRQTVALVGESGCGKSVTAMSIMGLVPDPPGKVQPGSQIILDGKSLVGLRESQMRQVRGAQVAMIFQEPMTSLNPVYTVGSQIMEAIQLHQKVSGGRARQLAVEVLGQVGISDAARRVDEYPHQMSGGMRQRVMIAMALSCNPKLLIADEPTTALDVTIQAQILDLLRRIQEQRGLSILLITHDLAVVAETADVVAVMYASKLAELAEVKTLFAHPLHPYTQGLFKSIPRIGQAKHRLEAIPGNVPNPLNFPSGCKFHPRCPLTRQVATGLPADQVAIIRSEDQNVPAAARCVGQEPPLREVQPGHWCACWFCPGYEEAPQSDPSMEKKS